MQRCSTLISLFLFLAVLPVLGQSSPDTTAQQESDSVENRSYNLLIQIRGRELTGLCIMEISPDKQVVGTIVNEFGAKIFDFTYGQGKARVLNVIKPIDKWYIRRVLRKDMAFILANLGNQGETTEGKRHLTVGSNGEMVATNRQFKINYTFTPMNREL